MNEEKFSKTAREKREIAEWRDGRGLYVILGIAALLVVFAILTAFGI
jgi:hypothetical protein